MVQAMPDNEQFLIAAAQSYSSFASLFVEDQDKEYANLLYGRKTICLKSLETRGFKEPLQRPFDEFKEGLNHLGKKDVPTIFWTATCWVNSIRLNISDSIEAISELPRVEWMMKRALELDEGSTTAAPISSWEYGMPPGQK